jgi:hypothetical protein
LEQHHDRRRTAHHRRQSGGLDGREELSDLYLPVKRIYFDSIKAGCKGEEYRLVTPYWTKRLVGRYYDQVIVTLGYPSAIDFERRLEFPWNGYRKTRLTHPHFGPGEVEVFAIALYDPANWK